MLYFLSEDYDFLNEIANNDLEKFMNLDTIYKIITTPNMLQSMNDEDLWILSMTRGRISELLNNEQVKVEFGKKFGLSQESSEMGSLFKNFLSNNKNTINIRTENDYLIAYRDFIGEKYNLQTSMSRADYNKFTNLKNQILSQNPNINEVAAKTKRFLDSLENIRLFTFGAHPRINIELEVLKRGAQYSGIDINGMSQSDLKNRERELARAFSKKAKEQINQRVATETIHRPQPNVQTNQQPSQARPNPQRQSFGQNQLGNSNQQSSQIEVIFKKAKQNVSNLPAIKTIMNVTKKGGNSEGSKINQPAPGVKNPDGTQVQNSGRRFGVGSVAVAAGVGAFGVYQYYQENTQVKHMVGLLTQIHTTLVNDLNKKKELLKNVVQLSESSFYRIGFLSEANEANACTQLLDFEIALVDKSDKFIREELKTTPDKIAAGAVDQDLGPIGSIIVFFNAVADAFVVRQDYFNKAAKEMGNVMNEYRQLLVNEEEGLKVTFNKVIDLGKVEVEGLQKLTLNSDQLTTEQSGAITTMTGSVENVWTKLKQAMPQSTDQFLKAMSNNKVTSATAIILTGGTVIYLTHKYWDDIKNAFKGFWTKVKRVTGFEKKPEKVAPK